jgi:hypothetical protein
MAAARARPGDGGDGGAFAHCPPALFVRAAVDLLLGITLPLTESDWAAAEHVSLARSQWEAALPPRPAVHAAGAGGAPAADGDAGSSGDDDGGGDDDDCGDAGGGGLLESASALLLPLGESGASRRRAPRAPAARVLLGSALPAAEVAAAAAAAAGPSPGAPARARAAKHALLVEQRRAFADAWLSVLQLSSGELARSAAAASAPASAPPLASAAAPAPSVSSQLPPDVLRRVLVALPARILPHLTARARQPLALAGFLTGCVDGGGVAAVLALEALFLLMQAHGLEYGRFYARVYALLAPAAVHARHRARFFKLLDLLLGSAALPAYLVAAFAKRAARLALAAAAPYALFALPFVYNCVRRHPACAALLHRPAPAAGDDDPFDARADDPAHCRALQSSLWELTALCTHYYAPVAYLARVFLRGPLTRADYDIAGAYAANVYAALAKAELARTARKAGAVAAAPVPLAFDAPPRAIAEAAAAAAARDGAEGGSGAFDAEVAWV